MTLGDKFFGLLPNIGSKLSAKSVVDIPFKYSSGNRTSIVTVRLIYCGMRLEENFISSLPLSLTRGTFTATSPIPVCMLRSGK